MQDVENIHEKLLASALLNRASEKSSAMIDSFASWLMLGFGGSVAFMLGNIESISEHLPVEVVRQCVASFFIIALLGVIEKFLATFIAAGCAGGNIGKELASEFPATADFNIDAFLSEAEKAIFPPIRYFVRRKFEKAKSGDFVVASRMFTKCAQIQGLIALFQAFIALYSVYLVLSRLAF